MITIFVLLLLLILFIIYAQLRVSRNFNRYSIIRNKTAYRGADVANGILRSHGIYNVQVERTDGHLTDHYDSKNKTIRLSDSVYDSYSLSAIAVAAHEVGHAIQDNENCLFLRLRNHFIPLVNIVSNSVWLLIFIGLLINSTGLINSGIIFFILTMLFKVLTLPVELDASHRALNSLVEGLYIGPDEIAGTRSVLGAATLIYVTTTVCGLVSLIRLTGLRDNNK